MCDTEGVTPQILGPLRFSALPPRVVGYGAHHPGYIGEDDDGAEGSTRQQRTQVTYTPRVPHHMRYLNALQIHALIQKFCKVGVRSLNIRKMRHDEILHSIFNTW